MDDRVDPQGAVDEATMLTEFLDWYRATLLLKAEGLSDEDSRRRACPPSTLNLMGLVRHMAEVERNWFQRVLLGEVAPPLFYVDEDRDRDMHPTDADTMEVAATALRTAIDRSRAAAAGVPLDQLAAAERHGLRPSLRWILIHMIEEYARHCGHADLLREAIDGSTGD
ncbi:MAG TPA: DinB family protein [Ilumatobacteraceae bacterium]|jgi:uncharacterized damage-inducible protein DinB